MRGEVLLGPLRHQPHPAGEEERALQTLWGVITSQLGRWREESHRLTSVLEEEEEGPEHGETGEVTG